MAAAARIDPAGAGAALDALLSWLGAQQKHRKAQLLEHDEPVHLLISLRRIPPARRTNPYLLPLPHPLLPDPSLCLILPDGHAEPSLPPFSSPPTLLPLSTLRSDFHPFEARRRLCASHDLFFADRRIVPLLPRLLGKHFFAKKKHPLRVDLARPDLVAQIRRACSSARMYVSTGTCLHLQIGRVSMPRDHVLENLAAALEAAIARIPKGWANVRGVYLKLEESVTLPIYQALPEAGLRIEPPAAEVEEEEVEQKKKRKGGTLADVRYMGGEADEGDGGSDVEEGRSSESAERMGMKKVNGIGESNVKDAKSLGNVEKRRKKGKKIKEIIGEDVKIPVSVERKEKKGKGIGEIIMEETESLGCVEGRKKKKGKGIEEIIGEDANIEGRKKKKGKGVGEVEKDAKRVEGRKKRKVKGGGRGIDEAVEDDGAGEDDEVVKRLDKKGKGKKEHDVGDAAEGVGERNVKVKHAAEGKGTEEKKKRKARS